MNPKWFFICLAIAFIAESAEAQQPELNSKASVRGPFVAPDEVVKKIKVGMTEAEVVKLLKPLANDSGTFYWGGSGRHTLYFAFYSYYTKRQIAIDFGEGPSGKVERFSGLHPKTKWTRYDGDSITVDMLPLMFEFKAK